MPNPLPKNRIWLSSRISEPAFDVAGQFLFYVSSADGRSRIVRQSLATGLAETITAEPTPSATVGYGGGVFAVRGSLLAYAAKGQLVVLDLAMGEQRTVMPHYEGLAAPALSPDGRFVAFVIEHDGHADVLVNDTAGDQLPAKVTTSPAFAANPTFSPDGARLAAPSDRWMAGDLLPRLPGSHGSRSGWQRQSEATCSSTTRRLSPTYIGCLKRPRARNRAHGIRVGESI